MMGSQGLAQRNFLDLPRSMESSADQAALKYLKATRQSAEGMLTLFEKLASQSIATLQNVDPYVMSHPMPIERIRNLENGGKGSRPYFDKKDPPELMLRHQLMQAKLAGYQNSAKAVIQRLSDLRPVDAGALRQGHRHVPPGRHQECPADHRQPDRRICRRTPISGSSRDRPCWRTAAPPEAVAPIQQGDEAAAQQRADPDYDGAGADRHG